MTLKEIRKTLKTEGELKIGNINLFWDGSGVEITKNDEYQETCNSWLGLREYLEELEELEGNVILTV